MPRQRSVGRLKSLRVHREIGFGPPRDHIDVHVVAEVQGADPLKHGFPLVDDGDRMVHEAWVAMLRDAVAHNLTVDILADHDTEAGNHGVMRDLTLTRG